MAIPILSDIFGQKPQVIPWQDVLLSDAQLQSLMTNIKDWSQIENLGNLWQNYTIAGLEKAVPGFGNLLSGMTGTAQSEFNQAQQMLEGKIPADVLAQTARTGAFQALGSTGATGSPLELSGEAAQFGLTSQGQILQGANLAGNAAQRWQQLLGFGQSTLAPIQQMLITPQEQFGANLTNEVNRQRTQQEAANVAAAPNPIAKGLSDLVAYLTASYIGHGPAGQPPAATNYSNLTDLGGGYASDSQGNIFPTTSGPYSGGGAAGAGTGSSNVAAAPGGINDTTMLPTGGTGTDYTFGGGLGIPAAGSAPLPGGTDPYSATGGYAGVASSYNAAYPAWLQGQGLSDTSQYPGYPALPGAPETY